MSLHAEFDHLPRLVAKMRTEDNATRRDTMMREMMETGGTWVSPRGSTTHLFEIQLHGITATGHSEDEAITNWIKNATRHVAHTTPLNRGAE